jgi:hypothetical protein
MLLVLLLRKASPRSEETLLLLLMLPGKLPVLAFLIWYKSSGNLTLVHFIIHSRLLDLGKYSVEATQHALTSVAASI